MGAAVASCAKPEREDITRLEQMAFDAWVEKYVTGQGIEVVRQSNGIWVEFIDEGDQEVSWDRDSAVWLRLNYTSTDIDGNVFVTRDSLHALRQRTYSPYTYYVPEYAYFGPVNFGMPTGQYLALKDELVKPDGSTMRLAGGSHVKLYIPSYMAYGTNGFSNDQGYGGQYALGETKIVIQDLSVRGVVKNPIDHESELVTELAEKRWGLTAKDTVKTLIFVDTLNFRPNAQLLADFPEKPFVKEYDLKADSTARIWYVGRFLPTEEYPDGFIFDTNIKSVYEKFYNRRLSENYVPQSKTFAALSYQADTDKDSFIAAFYEAIPALRRGQWSRIVFTSAYGYGASGLSAAVKQQQAQQQAMMDYYMQQSMYNSMYGGGMGGMYGSGYYDNYNYNSYYGGGYDYYGYSTSGYAEEESEQQITTEVQPYTPLVFEIYIEASGEEDEVVE